MNSLADKQIADEITISIHFVDGDTFVQPIPVEDAEIVQDFMDWFACPGKDLVWSWHVDQAQQIYMMHHSKIMAVDIQGYIEPEGRKTRWYERLLDKWRARKLYGKVGKG